MRKITENTNNIYMKARLKAAEYNDRLKSRAGAAEIFGVHESSIANYEKDLCKQIPTDMVVKMADTYNAPELMNYYCCNECPIGKNTVPYLELKDVSYIAIQLSVSLENPTLIINKLMRIIQDGVITENEKPEFISIVEKLVEFSKKAQSLELWAKKNLK